MPDPTVAAYRAGSALSRVLPARLTDATVGAAARAGSRRRSGRRRQVERNLRRILGPELTGRRLDRLVAASFESYARYYTESFRLPALSDREIADGFTNDGYHHIAEAVAGGPPGPILVLPHLGSWEWAGFWLTRIQGHQVTVVVEALEPPELFEWFAGFREQLGMHVLGVDDPGVGGALLSAIAENHVVCLLSDRLVGGTGIEVEFFGERTELPGGPATLALRSGCVLLPTGCYQRGDGTTHAVVRPPVPAERQGRLRDDVARVTQDLAYELELLIRAAPEQWHLMQPNWPSDRAAEAGR